MSDDYVDAAVIEKIASALEHSKQKLETVQLEYNRLKAQVVAYERTLAQLRALEAGDFEHIVLEESGKPTKAHYDSTMLKHQIYEYFSTRPRMTQSPSGITSHLADEFGWNDKGLHIRVSNLLRKIDKEEDWLEKKGHGKYQFVAP